VLPVRAFCVLSLLLAACAVIPGNYEGKSDQRTVRVVLKPDGFAALSTMFTGRPSRSLAEGNWVEEDGRIRLTLEGQTLVFQRRGDLLVAREWDRTVWGEQGPGVLQQVW
jgi:hypothetical protein